MKALSTFVAIIFSFIIFQEDGLASGRPCEELLSSHKDAKATGPLQEKIQNHEAQIKGLIHEYSQKLGPFNDPFAMAWTFEQGHRIFQHLLRYPKSGTQTESSFSMINQELKRAYRGGSSYNEKLLQSLIDDTAYGLTQPRLKKVDMQSHLLALQYATEYLRRFKEPSSVVDRDGERITPPKEETNRNKKKKKEEDQPPEYPDLPKEYRPSTKDTESGEGGTQKKYRVAEVNFKTPFFAQRYFSNVVRGAPLPFQETLLSEMLPQPSKFQSSGNEMIVRTFGAKKVDLFLPPGFKPLQPSDPRALILRSETGGYILELNNDLSEVHIPLLEDDNILMMPHMREIYTRPIGFKVDEWPGEIQASLIRAFSKEEAQSRPLDIAKAVAGHIASEYLYSVGPRSETDPVEALKAGAFQCDMAAYSMIGILRDVYEIPSRVVGGFRAKRHLEGKDGKSYLVVPGEGHAWVEVFHEGKWHSFDPTPIKKDRKQNEEGVDEYSDNELENTPEPQSEQSEQGQPQRVAGQSQDHQKRLKEETQKGIEKAKKEKTDEGKDQKAQDPQAQDPLDLEELARQLELGSLELEPQLGNNVLSNRMMRILLRTALDPTQRGANVQNQLNQISSLIRVTPSPGLKEIYQDGLSAHKEDHPDLKNWIDGLIRIMPGQEVSKTYQDIHQIKLALETYSKVLDVGGKIPVPKDLLVNLEDIQRKMKKLAHPDSQDIGHVYNLVKNLPGVTRQLLEKLYGLTQVGPNNPTREITKRLKKGELNDLRLMSILGPMTDFILNSTPRPENIEVKTWERNRRRSGRDLLPLQSFTHIARALRGRPEKTIEENIQGGTAFVLSKRRRVEIPAGHGKEKAERITVVLYDTSGSMEGDSGVFQAGLIAAFTGKALSDVSPSGHHRHRVVLVPFDSTPGTPVSVTNRAEAWDVIRYYQSKLKGTGGGTDIQKALLQGMSLIADAEKRSDGPLAAANIILMSDGQSSIDTAELLKARKAIDRRTPLQTMFIAIRETHEELMRFAMDSQSMGAERGFYREFTDEHIRDILAESSSLDFQGQDHFYTDKSSQDISSHVYDLLEESLRLAGEFSDQVYYGNQYISAKEHLENLEKLKWRHIQEINRPLQGWLVKVRKLARHPVFQDKRLLEKVVDDLLTHFERLTGTKMDSLSDFEQEQLRHLVRYAAGLEEYVF